MKLLYSKTFVEQFSQYDKAVQKQIQQAILAIPAGDARLVFAKGLQQVYRLKLIPRCRIFFAFDNQRTIRVLSIDAKGDIYNKILKCNNYQ